MGKFCASIWLALYPVGWHYTSDFGGAGPGLIRAKLKSEFTNKN